MKFLHQALSRLRGGHDARAIANLFVEQALGAQSPMSIMTLMRYVYLAHGWTLAYSGRPLIKHKFEAWRVGPVVPQVYHAFSWQRVFITEKAHGYHPEFGEFPAYSCSLNSEEQDIVTKVFDRYSRFDAIQLGTIISKPGAPWEHIKSQEVYAPIPNDLLKAYYKAMITVPAATKDTVVGERQIQAN